MSIDWPDGMMSAKVFINSAAEHYRSAANLRANSHHAAAAHEELNALLCQLAPVLISIAESLDMLTTIAKKLEGEEES